MKSSTTQKISQTWLVSQTRADRTSDRHSLFVAARAARGDIQHAAPEVGSSENRVQRDGNERDERDQRFGRHVDEYGIRASSKTSVTAKKT